MVSLSPAHMPCGQTNACFWLSLFLLADIGAYNPFGWWLADPLAALGMTSSSAMRPVEPGAATRTTDPVV